MTTVLSTSASESRLCCILNPGSRQGDRRQNGVRERLAELPGAEIRCTEGPGHAEELARRAAEEGFPVVVAAGGDGTLHEVVNGLDGHFDHVRLGVLPLGTGNDLCRSLEVEVDLDAAMARLRNATVRQVDLVQLRHQGGQRLLLNVAAFGITGEVSSRLDADLKRAWGPLAYLRAAIDCLPEYCQYPVEVCLDDEPPIVREVASVILANGRYAAAGIPVAPRAELDDGLVDVVLLSGESLADLAAVAAKVVTGGHLERPDERVLFRRARRGSLRPVSGALPGYADGEAVGAADGGAAAPDADPTIHFEVLPRRLQVLVDPPSSPP